MAAGRSRGRRSFGLRAGVPGSCRTAQCGDRSGRMRSSPSDEWFWDSYVEITMTSGAQRSANVTNEPSARQSGQEGECGDGRLIQLHKSQRDVIIVAVERTSGSLNFRRLYGDSGDSLTDSFRRRGLTPQTIILSPITALSDGGGSAPRRGWETDGWGVRAVVRRTSRRRDLTLGKQLPSYILDVRQSAMDEEQSR